MKRSSVLCSIAELRRYKWNVITVTDASLVNGCTGEASVSIRVLQARRQKEGQEPE
jgi:hypothetical protein